MMPKMSVVGMCVWWKWCVCVCLFVCMALTFLCFISGAGVKSFLERFGERCQELNTKNSPSVAKGNPSTSTPTATPKSRLVQERLANIQGTTATADLTQKQKMVSSSLHSVVTSQ